jgi:hypothetical protein
MAEASVRRTRLRQSVPDAGALRRQSRSPGNYEVCAPRVTGGRGAASSVVRARRRSGPADARRPSGWPKRAPAARGRPVVQVGWGGATAAEL